MRQINLIINLRVGLFWLLFLTAFGAGAQIKAIVTGRVVDSATGKPLSGATITEVNDDDRQINGVTADEDGNFAFKVTDTKNKLRAASIGYDSRAVTIGSRAVIRFALLPSKDDEMSGVVIISRNKVSNGITSTAKRDIIGAQSTIKAGEIFQDLPVTSIDQMIQGQAAGVQVVSNSGDPGAGVEVRIRGVGSLGSDNNPMYIIDGVPILTSPQDGMQPGAIVTNPLNDINPLDIEDIQILKDANAAAIYGSRAANGVIIIKTKRGKKSVTLVGISTRTGMQFNPPQVPLLNAAQYKVMRLEANQNKGNINPFNDAGGVDNNRSLNNDPNYFSYWYYQSDTKWVDLIAKAGLNQYYNMEVSGGGESVRYAFSTSYTDNQGTTTGAYNKRITGSFRLDYKVSNKLNIRANILFGKGLTSNTARGYDLAMKKNPSMPVYDVDLSTGRPNGNYLSLGGTQLLNNPVAYANTTRNNVNSYTLTPNINIDYNIAKNLTFTNVTSFNFNASNGFTYIPSEATGVIWNDGNFNSVSAVDNESIRVDLNSYLTYSKASKLFNNSVTVGNTFTNTTSNGLNINGYANPSSQIESLNGPARIGRIFSSSGVDNIIAYYIAGQTIFNDKYSVNFTMRADGSSKFGDSKKFGYFPAVGGYWRISSEEFMKRFSFINDLKFRASWGQTGRSGGLSSFGYISQYVAGSNYLNYTGIIQGNAELNNLQWEIAEQTNFGLNASLFNNRVEVILEKYTKESKRLLYPLAVPSSAGFGSGGVLTTNIGNIENRGVEATVIMDVVKAKKSRDFRWNVNFNIGTNRNIVTSLPGGTLKFDVNNGYQIQVKEGDPLGSYYGLKFLGVYATDADAIVKDAKGNKVYQADGITPKYMKINTETGDPYKGGDAIYEDFNHDGIIDDQDKILIGNGMPLFTGGLTNNFSYKGFNFSVLFYYGYGNDIINNAKNTLERMSNADNQAASVLRRWRKQGDQTNMPRAIASDTRNSVGSTRWVEDGSFFRLNNINVSYVFPPNILKHLRLKVLNINAGVNNIFTWTKYTGVDPEVGIGGSFTAIGVDNALTPRTRGFTVGLTTKF